VSKIIETKRAYDLIRELLDQELLAKKGSAQRIKDCQAALDVAFYLLGWAQFEYLSRREAGERIGTNAKAKTADGISWRYVLDNIKAFSLRKKLEVIFFSNQSMLSALNKDYDVRNEAAHNYKKLPAEVRDISAWLQGLEDLVDNF
jgi:hypothetical protein